MDNFVKNLKVGDIVYVKHYGLSEGIYRRRVMYCENKLQREARAALEYLKELGVKNMNQEQRVALVHFVNGMKPQTEETE